MPFALQVLVTHENCINTNALQSFFWEPVLGGHEGAELLLHGQLFSSQLP